MLLEGPAAYGPFVVQGPVWIGRPACSQASMPPAIDHASNPAWRYMRRHPVVLGFFDEPELRLRLGEDGLAPMPAGAAACAARSPRAMWRLPAMWPAARS